MSAVINCDLPGGFCAWRGCVYLLGHSLCSERAPKVAQAVLLEYCRRCPVGGMQQRMYRIKSIYAATTAGICDFLASRGRHILFPAPPTPFP